jgi:[Skp1-protein]-hydroxyproline N-acetylglucosaminyltransferase
LYLHYRQAKGPCYARALAQTLYNGQRYYLQIDCHMRFVKGWDTMLLAMLAKCSSSSKPVITTYPTGYERGQAMPTDR